jgi:RecA/RadA recombinase
VVNIIGDSSSGKTVLALQTLAEMSIRERFNDYDLYFDDAEAANEFDVTALWGSKLSDRILPPAGTQKDPEHSKTIQDFQANVRRCVKTKRPFVYILDSLDALTSDEEIDKVDTAIHARETGKEVSGSYGMEKAKAISQMLRMLVADVKSTKSLVIIISQTRDNIDPRAYTKKRRAGGQALRFYCCHEIWTTVAEKLRENKYKQVMGIVCTAKLTKNKMTGKLRTVDFPIYYSYGIDDIGSCITFMKERKFWPVQGGLIKAKELNITANMPDLIRRIEDECLERKLRAAVGQAWSEMEKEIRVERKPRYVSE